MSEQLSPEQSQTQSSQLLNEALAYVARYGHVGRPYTGTGLDSPADQSRFIQAMREQGFIAQAQEELINAFEEAKRQIEDKWNSYF